MDEKKMDDKKYGLILGWSCFFTLIGIYLLCKWIIWSTLNDGFWAKYGDIVMKSLYRIGFVGVFIFLFIKTIIYIRQSKILKKEKNNE